MKVTEVNLYFAEITQIYRSDDPFNYMLEVYMDDYILLAIPRSQDQLHNVSKTIIIGVHYLFPPDKDDKEDAISLKKF